MASGNEAAQKLIKTLESDKEKAVDFLQAFKTLLDKMPPSEKESSDKPSAGYLERVKIANESFLPKKRGTKVKTKATATKRRSTKSKSGKRGSNGK